MKLSTKAEQALERVGDVFDNAEKREDGLCRRIAGIEVKSLDVKSRSVEVIASSEAIDSYDEIVLQDWELGRYEKNPTVLYLHNSGGGFCGPTTKDTFPVGFATGVRVEDGQLIATLNFVDDKASPLAEYCWQGFVQKSLRAVSVGFRPRDVKPGKVDGKEVYFLSGNELFEISVVPMGANPDAVALMHKRNVALLKARVAKSTKALPAQEGQEKTMKFTEEQFEKLQADHDALKQQNESLSAKLATSETQKATAQSETAAAREATAKAVTEKNEAVAALTKANDDHAAEKATLEKSLSETKTAREAADAKVIELEVDALVGKKIAPAEKPEMLELRKTNPTLFASMMAKRSDSKLTEPVINPDPKEKNTAGDKSGASSRLVAAADK